MAQQDIGLIGLAVMGENLVLNMASKGFGVAVFNRTVEKVDKFVQGRAKGKNIVGCHSIEELVQNLKKPRRVMLLVKAGQAVDDFIDKLIPHLEKGDIIIDGGNSRWSNDIPRAERLGPKGIDYMDVGVSGGVWGLQRGYCMMIGGDAEVVRALEPIFETLAPGYGDIVRTTGRDAPDDRAEKGYIHAGSAGAGHFVKMVHNGIEYGLMQAYAEGFDILRNKASQTLPDDQRFVLDLPDIAEVWRRGSVISSWLLDLTAQALAGDAGLEQYTGAVADSGEGRWTIEAAMEEAVPANVLSAALYARYRSRSENTYGDRLLSAMRFGFGGHVEMPQ